MLIIPRLETQRSLGRFLVFSVEFARFFLDSRLQSRHFPPLEPYSDLAQFLLHTLAVEGAWPEEKYAKNKGHGAHH